MATITELAAMRHAIALSALGLGTTSPNPPVGCVILDPRGATVGAGFHRRKGEPHAEVHALRAAGPAARGGTAVVTLEPCNHVGVTPACRQELLNAGISRVVIGVIDPTSRGNGGAADLAAAGVDVATSVLGDEVLAVLGPRRTATIRQRPYVTWISTVQSGDSATAGVDDAAARYLRGRTDVLLSPGASVEGVPGGHSVQHFSSPPRWPDLSRPHDVLRSAFAAGVRTMAVLGTRANQQTWLEPGLLDEIVLTAGRLDPAQAMSLAALGELPDVFPVQEFLALPDSVVMRFRRPASEALTPGSR